MAFATNPFDPGMNAIDLGVKSIDPEAKSIASGKDAMGFVAK